MADPDATQDASEETPPKYSYNASNFPNGWVVDKTGELLQAPKTKKMRAALNRKGLSLGNLQKMPQPNFDEDAEEGEKKMDLDGEPMLEQSQVKVTYAPPNMMPPPATPVTQTKRHPLTTFGNVTLPRGGVPTIETPPGTKRLKSYRLEGGFNFSATFSDTQLNYVNDRATSYRVNKTLVSVGVAYAAYKQMYNTPPDKFTKTARFSWYHVNENGGRVDEDGEEEFVSEEGLVSLPEPVEAAAVCYTGPSKPLHDDKLRVVLIRPQEVGPSDNIYYHLIYDEVNAVIVSPHGDCIYLSRSQLTSKKPFYGRGQRQP